MLPMVTFPLLVTFAQNLPAPGQTGGAVATAPGEPAAELNVEEFQLKCNELTGQVVNLTFDRVVSFTQTGSESASATVVYNDYQRKECVNIIIPAEGIYFFKARFSQKSGDETTVYIQVLTPFMGKALGTLYDKDKPEGQRYIWK